MKVLFLSDTHGNLHENLKHIQKLSFEMIVFCGDNELSDFEVMSEFNIRKIGIHGNHPPSKWISHTEVFKKFDIEDISWKNTIIWDKKWFWLPGEMKMLLLEEIRRKNTFYSEKINTELKKFESKVLEMEKHRPDIIISHFPALWIMDNPLDSSHRGLNFLKEYIRKFHPDFFIHWHLHESRSEMLWNTRIEQIFPYKVLEI